MPEFVDNIVGFVQEKPALAIGAVAGVAVLFVIARKNSGPSPQQKTNGASGYGVNGSPLSNYTGSNVPVVMNYTPSMPAPGEQADPGTALVTLKRSGSFINVTGGPPGICPPGYVSVQQPGQAPRCSLVNDENKQKGQRTSYVPSLGQSPYVA
ncbi:MAG: hypothetical protein KDK27_08745 [Leptospiraceae bacterium]|nr:hypothetical protein [Leptospiraceae bacterium]